MAIFTVTTLNDERNPAPADNGLSLREALDLANAAAGADTIVFSDNLSGVVRLTQGELQIADQLLIDGGGLITISGDRLGDDVLANGVTDVAASLSGADYLADNTRLFSATSTALDVALSGLTLTGGRTTQNVDGGGALTSAEGVIVTITDSVISGNSTAGDGSRGGALDIGSEAIIAGSQILGNRTSGDFADGGGLSARIARITDSVIGYNATDGRYADGGATLVEQVIELTNSLLYGNSTGGYSAKGGAIFAGGAANILNSTFYGNETTGGFGDGGAIFGADAVTISSSTLTGNAAKGDGSYGGAIFSSGELTAQNSIVLGNAAPNGTRPEISLFDSFGGVGPSFAFQGLSIIGDGPQAFDASVSENVLNAEPAQVFDETSQNNGQTAGVLADNGGDQKTVALNPDPGNPALDAADGDAPGRDVRGIDIFDFPGVGAGGAQRDLGSFELDNAGPREPEEKSLVVTTTADIVDAYDGVTSLREAVAFANEKDGDDVITFAEGGQGLIRLTQGPIEITESLEIDGNRKVVISGDANGDDITRVGDITDVDASQIEGGVDLLDDNTGIFIATGDYYNQGQVVLTSLTLTGGRSQSEERPGGAISADYFDVTARNTTLAGNSNAREGANGGAISISEASVQLLNSTITGSRTDGSGGAVAAEGVTSVNSTITDNRASGAEATGGAFFLGVAFATITNSVILGNVTGAADGGEISTAQPGFNGNWVNLSGDSEFLTLSGFNIIGSTPEDFATAGVERVINAPAGLVFDKTISNSGVAAGDIAQDGSGLFVAPLRASSVNPALDASTSSFATDAVGAPRSFDQAGLDNGGQADIGAVELQTQIDAPPPPPPPAGATPGPDTLTGDGEANDISGLRGADTITGLGGADTLNGGGGRDVIEGNGGGDVISGGGGGDQITGNGGRDMLSGGGGRDSLDGGGGRDQVAGDGGRDMVKGGGGRDTLEGGGGRDFLDGGGGRDFLDGSNGADTLVGGRGNDVLTGGGGLDTFRFTRGDGRDTITDFDQLRDRIEILDGASSFDDLMITQAGNNVRIAFANVVITVENDLAENFTAADFIF